MSEGAQERKESDFQKVLFISSFHLLNSWSQGAQLQVVNWFDADTEKYHVDYLEFSAMRADQTSSKDKLDPYLELLEEGNYQMVISMLDEADHLLLENYREIPKDLPIVFCSLQQWTSDFKKHYPNTLGIYVDMYERTTQTLSLGMKLMPQAREVLIVSGENHEGTSTHQKMQANLPQYPGCTLKLINQSEYSTAQMLEAISQLPPASFIIFTGWSHHVKEGYSSLQEIAEEINRRARCPWMVVSDELIGKGALGGQVNRGSDLGKQALSIIKRVLGGEKPESIAYEKGESVFVFDMEEMEEAKLNSKLLPEGTFLVNEGQSVWDKYWKQILLLGAAFLVTLFSLVVVSFFYARYHHFSRLTMTLFNALPLRICVSDRQGNLLFHQVEKELREKVGKPKNLQDITGVSSEEILKTVQKVYETGEVSTVHYRYGNTYRQAQYYPLEKDVFGSEAVLWVSQDVTRERELENEKEQMIKTLNNLLENSQIINECLKKITLEDDLDKVVLEMLETLGQKANSDRCYVYQYSQDYGEVTCFAKWTDPEVPLPMQGEYQKINTTAFSNFLNLLREKKDLISSDTLQVQEGMEKVFAFFKDNGICSILLTGIWLDGKLWGFMGLDFIRKSFEFSADDVRMIHDAAHLFQMAHIRHSQNIALADSAYLQKQIFDNVSIPIVLFDVEGRIVTANPSYQALVGKNEAQLVGFRCNQNLCKYPEKPQYCPSARALLTKESCRLDYFGYGEKKLLVHSQPIFDRNHEIIYVLESAVDVTRQHLQQQQLEINNTLLNRAAEMAHITYFKGNLKGEVILSGGDTRLGIPMDQNLHLLTDWVESEDAGLVEKFLTDLRTQEGKTSEMVCRSSVTGKKRNFWIRAVFQQSKDSFYIGVCQDITKEIETAEIQKQLISQLNEYIDNERILNTCLTYVVMEHDFKQNIKKILESITHHLHGDRAYTIVFSKDLSSCKVSNEYTLEGVPSVRSEGVDNQKLCEFFLKNYPIFAKNEMLKISDVPHSEYAPYLATVGSRAMRCTPVWMGDHLLGVFVIDFVRENAGKDVDLDKLDNVIRSTAQILGLSKRHFDQKEALITAEKEKQVILSHVKVPIFLFDRNHKLIRANPAACAVSRKTEEEILKKECFYSFCDEDSIPDYCPVRKVLETGQTCSFEIKIQGTDFIMTAEPIFNLNGEVDYVVESGLDVTEIKENQKKLETAMKAAQAADRAKSYFLATMSHELRTPLNAVLAFSELLGDESISTSERKDYLESIRVSGKALLKLISDVLDISKIESDQVRIVSEKTDLSVLVKEIDAIFALQAAQKKLQFEIHSSKELPLLTLDSFRLRQVLLNLVGNAIKFTHQGWVKIDVKFQPDDEKKGTLLIRIEDTGIGIKKEFFEEVFTPFVQQDAVRGNRTYEGSGLGIPISDRLVKKMGGELLLQSEEGKGSVFTVCLHEIPYEATPGFVGKELGPKNKASDLSFLEKKCILVVDDVPMNVKVLSTVLRKLKVQVETAFSGGEALKKLESLIPDYILTDIWMPTMNGVELAEKIRTLPACQKIPIIAVTADTEVKNNFEMKDFNEVFFKPVTADQLEKLRDL